MLLSSLAGGLPQRAERNHQSSSCHWKQLIALEDQLLAFLKAPFRLLEPSAWLENSLRFTDFFLLYLPRVTIHGSERGMKKV